MNEILQTLTYGDSVLLERDKLDEFLEYSLNHPENHSYLLEYSDGLVKITMTEFRRRIKL